MDQDEEIYEENWEVSYERIRSALTRFGREDAFGHGDFWVVDESYGYNQHKVYFCDLRLLDPEVIKTLQGLLHDFPGWEIFVAVDLRDGASETWPDMGLIVREYEIIDALQRQYFPPEFRDLRYEGSRPGTDRE
jgi:hypothetical protein